MQPFHLYGVQISPGDWRTRPSVLLVEAVHLKGGISFIKILASRSHKSWTIIQVTCSSMDCTSSVVGPTRPSMPQACCSQFQTGVCDSTAIRSLPPMEEGDCQRRCWAEKDCLFFSSSPSECLLHSLCPPQRKLCQGCRSGSKRPLLDKLPGNCGADIKNPSTETTKVFP